MENSKGSNWGERLRCKGFCVPHSRGGGGGTQDLTSGSYGFGALLGKFLRFDIPSLESKKYQRHYTLVPQGNTLSFADGMHSCHL